MAIGDSFDSFIMNNAISSLQGDSGDLSLENSLFDFGDKETSLYQQIIENNSLFTSGKGLNFSMLDMLFSSNGFNFLPDLSGLKKGSIGDLISLLGLFNPKKSETAENISSSEIFDLPKTGNESVVSDFSPSKERAKLARAARYYATEADLGIGSDGKPRGHDGGDCYYATAQAIAKATGVQLSGRSAYMAADQLAASDKFEEISVSKEDLKNLPEGAVIVWDKGRASNGKWHEHGHIATTSGNGREYSDIPRDLCVNYGTEHRVFIPKETSDFGLA